MKVLVTSPAFLPSVGGLEIATGRLAAGLAARGHAVTVATETAGSAELPGVVVVRRPSPLQLLRRALWCDVFYQANVSLRMLWPLLLVRRPWVVSHHTWYRDASGRVRLRDRLKRQLLRRAAGSIAVSRAVAAELPPPITVIHNGYRDDLFRLLPGVERSEALLFVGRLVSDKGCDVLLEALAALEAEGLTPPLSVVGDGPERVALEALAARRGIVRRVAFLGTRTGEDLVALLNRHQVLVLPSRYAEPFGVVALEGIACGCVVVGTQRGGLPEAIGPCGLVVPNADVPALAQALATLLRSPETRARLRAPAQAHLSAHLEAVVLNRYEAVLEAARRSR